MMTANLRFSDMVGAVCDVDGGTWAKACLGIGATSLAVRLVKAHSGEKGLLGKVN